jgi:hypothetical protein
LIVLVREAVMVRRSAFGALLLLLVVAPTALARVLSYSPYTNRAATPAYQLRSAPEIVLVEQPGTQFTASQWMDQAEVVVYHVQGASEPRVIFPAAGEPRATISFAAHGRNGAMLVQTTSNYQGRNAPRQSITLLGDLTGTSWTRIPELDGAWVNDASYYEDLGGYYTRGLRGSVRPVSSGKYLFVVDTSTGIWGIEAGGKAKRLLEMGGTIIGNDATSSRIIIQKDSRIWLLDLSTEVVSDLGPVQSGWYLQGWVAGNDRAYVLTTGYSGRYLNLYRAGSSPQYVGGPYPIPQPVGRDPWSFVAAPTHDYAGAWMVQRDFGKPTTLLRHTEGEGVKELWSDVSGPQIEALHPGATGERLLIQVHRPRVQPDRWFIDPALAIWKIGDPAPRDYDELFVAETELKGFVHLDVDAMAQGAPFVFDSGVGNPPDSRTSPPISGGGDVVQEWGVVRSSLKQELVLPGIARLPGAFNSYWQSDVVIYNPTSAAQPVVIRYAPLASSEQPAATTITLAPREIRVIKDALKELFAIETGGGSLHLEPGVGVAATGRTYTSNATGTFGFSMTALDALTAAGARFPLSFAGAFPGSSFRTNILLTAPRGLTAGARLQAYGISGEMGSSDVTLSTVSSGVWQMNNVSSALSLASHDEGGLVVRPTHGFVIPTVVAIDNITNDSTYFPPDLPAPVIRTIPAVGHLDGANNSKFRSDLYLLNLSTEVRTVMLEATSWDGGVPKTVQFTLLPNEDRVIRDVLPRLFGMTGFARLRYMSFGDDAEGVRVTSRAYNQLENGGTLGCLIPPLNSFQSAASGETLEILGVVGDSRFRANIGLVELSPAQGVPALTTNVRIRIIDETGTQIDTFEVALRMTGGMQINDVLNARGLTAAKAVLIRIEPTGPGLVGAYATLTDNGTNDPSFLAATLGAQE